MDTAADFEPGSLLRHALALPRQGAQLAQGGGRWLPSRQHPLQTQAAEQAGIELVGLAFLLRTLGEVLDLIGQQNT